jgi:hypothetical protein
VASCSDDRSVKVWDAASGQQVSLQWPISIASGTIRAVAVSPGGAKVRLGGGWGQGSPCSPLPTRPTHAHGSWSAHTSTALAEGCLRAVHARPISIASKTQPGDVRALRGVCAARAVRAVHACLAGPVAVSPGGAKVRLAGNRGRVPLIAPAHPSHPMPTACPRACLPGWAHLHRVGCVARRRRGAGRGGGGVRLRVLCVCVLRLTACPRRQVHASPTTPPTRARCAGRRRANHVLPPPPRSWPPGQPTCTRPSAYGGCGTVHALIYILSTEREDTEA